MTVFHWLGFSQRRYKPPVLVGGAVPPTYSSLGWTSPTHVGPFRHAVDFVVPNPLCTSLDVRAPMEGVITDLNQHGTVWGPSAEFNAHLNYITVLVDGRSLEFWQICHLAAGSCPYSVGDVIEEGSFIGRTGLNGWITTTTGEPDSHVHMLVGVWLDHVAGTFRSLRIRFTKERE